MLSYKSRRFILLLIFLLLETGAGIQSNSQQETMPILQKCLLTNITSNKTLEIPAHAISQLAPGQYILTDTYINLNLTHTSHVICEPHQYLLLTDNKTLITMIKLGITNSTLSLQVPVNLDVKEIQAGGIKLSEPQKLNTTLYWLHDGEFKIETRNNTLARSLLRRGFLIKFEAKGNEVYFILYPTENSSKRKTNHENTGIEETNSAPLNTVVTPNAWVSKGTGHFQGGPGEGRASNNKILYAITLIASIATLLYYLAVVRNVESNGY